MRINQVYILTLMLLFGVINSACKGNQEKSIAEESVNNQKANITKRVSVIKVNSPKAGGMYTVGDAVNIQIELKKVDIIIDSLVAESKGNKTTLGLEQTNYLWNTEKLNVGNNQLKIYAYSDGHKVDSYSLKLRFKSDILPELYECKIVNTYPHDKTAYTQGLIYEDGIMYEGTGNRGESVLKKIDFEKGKLISELSLPAQYFGEGITSFGDKIIQLTYTSRIGFVYDKNSFKLLTKFEYPTQGWGLTTYNDILLMSDGTNIVHFLDPEYLNEISKIEIYDNNGPVQSINELEYFEGLVYANIYQSKEIIAFDPKTGKVIKRIDCSKIVPKGYENETDNVLNGIAYDKDNDRIFITGKRWPSLFEVKFEKK